MRNENIIDGLESKIRNIDMRILSLGLELGSKCFSTEDDRGFVIPKSGEEMVEGIVVLSRQKVVFDEAIRILELG